MKKATKKPPSPIGDVLRQAVLDAGVSRYRLSAELCVDQALLSRFVAGTCGVSLKMADRLADRLGYRLTKVEGR